MIGNCLDGSHPWQCQRCWLQGKIARFEFWQKALSPIGGDCWPNPLYASLSLDISTENRNFSQGNGSCLAVKIDNNTHFVSSKISGIFRHTDISVCNICSWPVVSCPFLNFTPKIEKAWNSSLKKHIQSRNHSCVRKLVRKAQDQNKMELVSNNSQRQTLGFYFSNFWPFPGISFCSLIVKSTFWQNSSILKHLEMFVFQLAPPVPLNKKQLCISNLHAENFT